MVIGFDGGEEARCVFGIDIIFTLRLEPEIPEGLAEFQNAGLREIPHQTHRTCNCFSSAEICFS
jgi:hypothetical protein